MDNLYTQWPQLLSEQHHEGDWAKDRPSNSSSDVDMSDFTALPDLPPGAISINQHYRFLFKIFV